MPPKARYTREEILDAGVAILRERGIAAVTAREIGKRLGSSARPIFTVFTNMGGVLAGVKGRARQIYGGYVRRGLEEELAFRGVGQAYIAFACREPKLFQLLFMQKQAVDMGVKKILPEIDENYSSILHSITAQYPVSMEEAAMLYRHLWVYSHGIAALCATDMCRFTDEEIRDMLTEVFKALLSDKLKGKTK